MRVRVYPPPFGDGSIIDEKGFVTLPEGTTLGQLLKMLKVPFRAGMVRLCMVNYERARLSAVLQDGDTVSFLLLVPGG